MAVTLIVGVIGYVLWIAIVLVLARVVVEWVRQFARKWRPVGLAAIGLELVYVTTDPPILLLRRLVPPLRIGTVSLDLSVLILLIALIVVRVVILSFA